MANDLKETLRLKADSSGFVGEVRVAGEEIDKLANKIGQMGKPASGGE